MSKSVRVAFSGHNGAELSAILEQPSAPPKAYAMFAHCFTCSKDIPAAKRISQDLRDEGIATLRLDFTGLGESEGEFSATTFSSNVEDLVQAAAFLESEHQAPRLLIGHSLGGAAVISAAAQLSTVRAVAAIAAPSGPEHLERLFVSHRETIEREGEAEVNIGGRPFRIGKKFLDDLQRHTVLEIASELKTPLLVMHAPGDDIVGIEHARRIFEAARHPKSYVSLDGADHLIRHPRDAAYIARMIIAWSSRYLNGHDG